MQSSDVDSDHESFHTKARHILRRLQSGQYDGHFAGGVYRCPFCPRRLHATDFSCLVNHAKSLGSSSPKVGKTVNVYSFMSHHKALWIHLRSLQAIHRRNFQAMKDVLLHALNMPVALSVCVYPICKAA